MMADQHSRQDPTEQYGQRRGQPVQKQPPPGTGVRMDPPPDHGEESYRGSGRLTDRRAVITGGDSGIGRAVALAFAREGADVVLSYLPQEERDARETVRLVESAGRRAVPVPGDITTEHQCVELVRRAVEELGGIDILVNNAGYQMAQEKGIAEISTEQFDRVLKTNLYALFWICRAAVPHMPPGSSIINTSSIQAFDPSPSLLDYATTKAGIVNFTKGLAANLVDQGIRVNSVAPGPVWTPLIPATMPPEAVGKFGTTSPIGRPAQPAELAPSFVFFASQESSYTTGEVLAVTGGRRTI
ncbi:MULTISPECIES: SDR family oxidoreductase [unclassified Solwaraspora]|uniref:SDR family oxidoreductase n=1 Tax=unclassified Solwaraspora TaxID=2627926 RepID=UPI00248CD51F|nr:MULTISPECIES: SDR family oxidoreductase [unclassified Solwaraspora]WBC00327.1 SDR family oxidoreductase [Solwaraspora sp. WMMA2059]WBC23599.1 SDR family oxidoreductase [Solwaraspora sp. WMMA2080]WJK37712.1 SDR family oxidoreductase [Solwaraspora sp. WMMA2065]